MPLFSMPLAVGAASFLLILFYVCFSGSSANRSVYMHWLVSRLVLTGSYAVTLGVPDAGAFAAALWLTGFAVDCSALLAAAGVFDKVPRFIIAGAVVLGTFLNAIAGELFPFAAAALFLCVALSAMWLIKNHGSAFKISVAMLSLGCTVFFFMPGDWNHVGHLLLLAVGVPAAMMLMGEKRSLRGKVSADAVTGALTLDGFSESFNAILTALKTENRPLTLIAASLREAPETAGKHGEELRDEALAIVARAVNSNLRGGDAFCRRGGDEFLIILPRVLPSVGENVSRRVAEQLKKSMVPEYPDYRAEVNFGVTGGVPKPEYTVSYYIERADKALFEAKAAGAGKIVILPTEDN